MKTAKFAILAFPGLAVLGAQIESDRRASERHEEVMARLDTSGNLENIRLQIILNSIGSVFEAVRKLEKWT